MAEGMAGEQPPAEVDLLQNVQPAEDMEEPESSDEDVDIGGVESDEEEPGQSFNVNDEPEEFLAKPKPDEPKSPAKMKPAECRGRPKNEESEMYQSALDGSEEPFSKPDPKVLSPDSVIPEESEVQPESPPKPAPVEVKPEVSVSPPKSASPVHEEPKHKSPEHIEEPKPEEPNVEESKQEVKMHVSKDPEPEESNLVKENPDEDFMMDMSVIPKPNFEADFEVKIHKKTVIISEEYLS